MGVIIMKKFAFSAVALLVAGTAMADTAQAAGPDLTTLSAGVDYSTVGPAILAAGAAGIGMLLAWVAVKYVRRVVRSA